MKPTYSVEDIANYFLCKAQDEDKPEQRHLSNLKLQKLLYYAQGLYLAAYGSPLFRDAIIAWQYGPVIPSLYSKYRKHGSDDIPGPDSGFHPEDIFDRQTREFFDDVYEFFGRFSATGLMRMAYADRCYIGAGFNNEITPEAMQRDLRKYLKNEQRKETPR
jgi:uncharacterized phage-associated protein